MRASSVVKDLLPNETTKKIEFHRKVWWQLCQHSIEGTLNLFLYEIKINEMRVQIWMIQGTPGNFSLFFHLLFFCHTKVVLYALSFILLQQQESGTCIQYSNEWERGAQKRSKKILEAMTVNEANVAFKLFFLSQCLLSFEYLSILFCGSLYAHFLFIFA